LVASTDLEKTLDAMKEVTRGASVPPAKTVVQLTNSPDLGLWLIGPL
jgi:hypothetical protein